MAIRPTMFAANTVAASAISVDTTADGTLLVPKDDNRGEALMFNNGVATVFLGPFGVTIATGLPFLAGAYATIQGQFALYGIVAAGAEEMRVMPLTDVQP